MAGKTIAELVVGETASFTKTISEYDVYAFAGITGDMNPVHIDRVAAEASPFGARVAHGMLTASLLSTVLGARLPGEGTIYRSQTLKFIKPVYIGDTITATAVVAELLTEKNRVVLKTRITNQNGELVAEGESLVSPPKAAE